MLSAKIIGKGKVEVRDVPIPVPKDGEVLIKMKASALCRSDLHIYHGEPVFDTDMKDIITPGHEPCGVVEKVGENVKHARPGDRVAIYLAIGCGKCSYCLQGYPMLCKEFRCLGFDLDGAHADYIVVPEDCCLPLPDEMSFVAGALSTDVGGTLYTACKRLGVSGATTVAVFGIGPMGGGGVLMAKAFGARVIAIDVDPQRLEYAKRLGADEVVNPKDGDSVAAIRKLTNGLGVDVAIDCSGNQKAQNDALDCTRAMGKVGFIGESKVSTINPSNQLIRKILDVKGCWYFNKSDWSEIADFIVSRKVDIEQVCSHKFSIDQAPEAFRLFDAHATQKAVFIWD